MRRTAVGFGLALWIGALTVAGVVTSRGFAANAAAGARIRALALEDAAARTATLPAGGQVVIVAPDDPPIGGGAHGVAYDVFGIDIPAAFAFGHPGIRHRVVHITPGQFENATPRELAMLEFRLEADAVLTWVPARGAGGSPGVFAERDLTAEGWDAREVTEIDFDCTTYGWDFSNPRQAHAWQATPRILSGHALPEWQGPAPGGGAIYLVPGPKDGAFVGPLMNPTTGGVPTRMSLEARLTTRGGRDSAAGRVVAALGPDGVPFWHTPLPGLPVVESAPALPIPLAGLAEAAASRRQPFRLALVVGAPGDVIEVRRIEVTFVPIL